MRVFTAAELKKHPEYFYHVGVYGEKNGTRKRVIGIRTRKGIVEALTMAGTWEVFDGFTN